MRTGSRGTLAGTLALLALLPLLPARNARGDFEEIEHRLKSAGVSPLLRTRVHASIDRAVGLLAKMQRQDGGLPPGVDPKEYAAEWTPGVTALAGLACRHAGTPEGNEVATRAVRWLLPDGVRVRPEVTNETYTPALTLMLLQASGGMEEAIRDLAGVLAESQIPGDGWWGYHTPRWNGRTREGWKGAFPEGWPTNLSSTQFVALGLRAASRAGVDVPPEVWRTHLFSLLDRQSSRGSWAYNYIPGDGYTDYPCGTFMGFANLILAAHALEGDPGVDAASRVRVDEAMTRGREGLERDGLRLLHRLRRGYPPHKEGRSFYDLYALEKACVFAGIERLGDVPWYAAMAGVLVDVQNPDGGWGSMREGASERRWIPRSSPITTAFALLILVRSSEVYRTSTPRDVDGNRSVATGGPVPRDPADPGLPPAAPGGLPPGFPLLPDEAADSLLLLEQRLSRPEATEAELVQALDFVSMAYDDFRKRPDRDDWRRKAERLLLGAVVPGPPGKGRLPVRIAAARILARTDPRIAPGFRDALERGPLDPDAPDPGPAFHEAAFGALAALGGAESLGWLIREVVVPDYRRAGEEPSVLARLRIALRSVALYEGLPGGVRLDACRRLVRAPGSFVEPVEESALRVAIFEPGGGPPEPTTEDALLDGLLTLARDPLTGRRPSLPSGARAGTRRRFDLWLAGNGNQGKAPWRDR